MVIGEERIRGVAFSFGKLKAAGKWGEQQAVLLAPLCDSTNGRICLKANRVNIFCKGLTSEGKLSLLNSESATTGKLSVGPFKPAIAKKMSIVLPRLQGISPAQFSHVLEALRQHAAALAMGQPFSIPDTNKALTDALSNSGLPSTPLLLSNLASCIDVMRILDQLRHTYWYYNGPIKVLGFDAFVLTHEVLKAAVQANGGYERLVEAQSKYGNQFGNLLQLGGLAFAPDTVEVSRLVQHMNSTYQVRRARLLPAASMFLYISILSAHTVPLFRWDKGSRHIWEARVGKHPNRTYHRLVLVLSGQQAYFQVGVCLSYLSSSSSCPIFEVKMGPWRRLRTVGMRLASLHS
jgi:hypothetical protein